MNRVACTRRAGLRTLSILCVLIGPIAVGGAVEVGDNDKRISDMGPNGSPAFAASSASVAYSEAQNRYLIVWSGDDDRGGVVVGEFEIFGQFIDAEGSATGLNDFRISFQGGSGDRLRDALGPDVVWNPLTNQYLVVWIGDRIPGEREIFGQILDGVTGSRVGLPVRISDMGPDSSVAFDAEAPRVIHNALTNEYLVVWSGDDLIDGEYEIYGQRLDALGVELGTNDFQISSMGPEELGAFDAQTPALAWNAQDGGYLVVWSGDDRINGEFEIFGQRLDAAGSEIGEDDFRISDMGPPDDPAFDADSPALIHHVARNEYLVVWRGDDDRSDLADNEFEIFGQRLNAVGAEIGTDDQRISFVGPAGSALFSANAPRVACDTTHDEYLVVWHADNEPTVPGEVEIYGRALEPDGTLLGNMVRFSDMGPDGVIEYVAALPALAYNSLYDEYLIAWQGDDDRIPLVDGEQEIFTQIWGDLIPVDSDGDGVRDNLDLCPGFDDTLDDDGDSVADGCDACPGVDDLMDLDQDGVAACGGDCDDEDASNFPGNVESCDGRDNNCDARVDENVLSVFHRDSDGDGFGDPETSTDDCSAPEGYVIDDTDCDDGNDSRFPGNAEVCDSIDNDCDAETDEGVQTTYFVDSDGDGFGDPAISADACVAPPGYVTDDTDCDDGNESRFPGNLEICDDIDNDCDAETDEGVQATYFVDADGDGFGGGSGTLACAASEGYVPDNTDCDDDDANNFPYNLESCDGRDNDCDGMIDEGSTTPYYPDVDGDGYGDSARVEETCVAPEGFVPLGGDCDDAADGVHPFALELCDGIDNDCDGSTPTVELDNDGDGVAECSGDCDDSDPDRNPLAAERCDGLDNNCDGSVDEGFDADLDNVPDCSDNCASLPNPEQLDFDNDGYGDRCESGALLADVDHSSKVDGFDLAWMARAFGSRCVDPAYSAEVDLDRDAAVCMIDGEDLARLTTFFGQELSGP